MKEKALKKKPLFKSLLQYFYPYVLWIYLTDFINTFGFSPRSALEYS